MKLRISCVLLMIVICAVLLSASGCFSTDPPMPGESNNPSDLETNVPEIEMSDALEKIFCDTVIRMSRSEYYKYNYAVMDYTALKVEENTNDATVYAVVMYREYSYADDVPSIEFCYHEPIKAVFANTAYGYVSLSYDRASENEKYPEGFPEELKANADPTKYEKKHSETCLTLAKTRYKMINDHPKYPMEAFDATFRRPKEIYETSLSEDDRYAMHVINSIDDLRAYFTMLSDAYVGIGGISDMKAEIEKQIVLFSEKYPAEIYEDTSLIFIHYVFGNWDNECVLESIYNDGESLTVNLVWTMAGALDSFEGKLFVLSMPRAEIEGCTRFSLDLKDLESNVEIYESKRETESGQRATFKLIVTNSYFRKSSFYVTSRFNGECELRDGYLYMYADDDRGTYVFKNLDGNRYEFVADMSEGDFGGMEILDGEILVLKRGEN